jgi:hypothetical protein
VRSTIGSPIDEVNAFDGRTFQRSDGDATSASHAEYRIAAGMQQPVVLLLLADTLVQRCPFAEHIGKL